MSAVIEVHFRGAIFQISSQDLRRIKRRAVGLTLTVALCPVYSAVAELAESVMVESTL